jgi:hypothetical protein
MPIRLRPTDITNYALNELEPRERLYVESMMLACEESRQDALGMIGLARLLEEGMQAEADSLPLALDETRREQIFATRSSDDGLLQHVWRAAAATVAMAACVVFSIAAPQVWNSAMRPIAQQSQLQYQQQADAANLGAELDSWTTLLQAASVAAFGALEEPEPAVVPEEFPTRILMPKGTVGMLDVPMPGLGGGDEN